MQEFVGFHVNYKEEGHEYIEEEDKTKNLVPWGIIALEQIFDRQEMQKVKKKQCLVITLK